MTKTIDVNVLADSLNEGNEVFYINLSGATNASIADNQGSVTITDDDGPRKALLTLQLLMKMLPR